MNKAEMEHYLISELLKEKNQSEINIPLDGYQREQMLRALFNVRPPAPISNQFLEIQNTYLQLRHTDTGLTDSANLQPTENDQRIYLWRGDITTLKTGAIINAANSKMLGCFIPNHACIDNAIHTYAGIQLRQECYKLMKEQEQNEPTGTVKVTSAYNLPCRYILHTVGPIVYGELNQKHRTELVSCYLSCLKLSVKKEIESIAFCCISTGEFHFPKQEAAEIAVTTVKNFLREDTLLKRVIFNVFTHEDYLIYHELLKILS